MSFPSKYNKTYRKIENEMPSTQGFKLIQVVCCPYDQLHIMPKQSFLRHLDKCKSKNKDEFKQCPYNIFHVMKKELYQQHVKNCTSKNDLQDLCDDQWSEGDQQVLDVEDWGVIGEEEWGASDQYEQQVQYQQNQQKHAKQQPSTQHKTIKQERNILAQSKVRPVMINDSYQSPTPTHQLAQQLRSLIINCQQDRQSESYWLGGNDNIHKSQNHELIKQQQLSQVKEKQLQLINNSSVVKNNNKNSRVFAQSCIVNKEYENDNAKKILTMSFYQGMNNLNNGIQNNNQNFIFNYSISQVHNYNRPYLPQQYYYPPQYYQHGCGYPGQSIHPQMQYPYPPIMGYGHFPTYHNQTHDKKEDQKKMKKAKHREEKSKDKAKKQKKDKKKSKKSNH